MRLHGYWARLELTLKEDLISARGVWENLLKSRCDFIFLLTKLNFHGHFHFYPLVYYLHCLCSGSMLAAWQGYIAMELETGHIKEARSIYKRCYSKRFAGTGSEVYFLRSALFVLY